MTAWTDERKKPAKNRREIPKMPEGYYSGDKPNPNLRAFVEAHLLERPYDPETDKYDVPPFDHPITLDKRKSASMDLHIYWSKKPHDAIRQYIRHYTKPGDLVLDPFCGSGGTALAALMEGRKAIAIDRSPAATFITKNYCTPVDVDELKAAFEELKKKVKPEIDWLYETSMRSMRREGDYGVHGLLTGLSMPEVYGEGSAIRLPRGGGADAEGEAKEDQGLLALPEARDLRRDQHFERKVWGYAGARKLHLQEWLQAGKG